ncbi:MAG TPA: transcriptional regulator [Propionicimonas sp.]|uniref:transcriptional regulator n=1 Tax=Propionicimonas sp. TaxID=1955623 RepID=UPI002F3FDAAC
MSSHRSPNDLLTLHGVRVLGSPSIEQLIRRFRIDAGEAREALLDAQAFGWVTRYDFLGDISWSLTDAGRAQDERLLAAELDAVGARDLVVEAHAAFLPLNRLHGRACTNWQVRPTSWDPTGRNDHSDLRWDAAALLDLERADAGLATICARLTAVLARFDGYAQAHHAALQRVQHGDGAWLDGPGRASCQLVWIGFHEDLLATLGIPRGSDG